MMGTLLHSLYTCIKSFHCTLKISYNFTCQLCLRKAEGKDIYAFKEWEIIIYPFSILTAWETKIKSYFFLIMNDTVYWLKSDL